MLIEFISKPLLKDKDGVVALVKCDGYLAIKYAHTFLESIKLKVHLGYINKFWWTDRAFVMEAQEFLPKEYFNSVLEKINTIESIKKNLTI